MCIIIPKAIVLVNIENLVKLQEIPQNNKLYSFFQDKVTRKVYYKVSEDEGNAVAQQFLLGPGAS
jgi:hypothetical protein